MKRITVALLAFLVALSGCNALSGGPPPSDERALDARNRTADALEDVSTYRFEVDARAEATGGDETRTVHVDGEGAVDRRTRRAVTNSTVDGETRSSYLDGRTVYTECPEPWGRWGVENASESAEWFALTPLGRQVALLDRTEVYWRGNRTVDDRETKLVVAHPSEETLASLPDGGGSAAGDLSRANVDNSTFRMWIDSGTGLPVQSELRIEVSSGGGSGVAEVTTRFHAYGEPADVSVPGEAGTDRWEFGCPGE